MTRSFAGRSTQRCEGLRTARARFLATELGSIQAVVMDLSGRQQRYRAAVPNNAMRGSMFRQAALMIALTLVPAVASAQQHQHDAPKKPQHEHTTAVRPSDHTNFVQLLMEKRVELKLTEEQITKLENASAKMTKLHAEMKKTGAKYDHSADNKMHDELLAIFTEEQLVKIRPLMKAHIEGKCDASADKQCKLEAPKKTSIQ